MHKSCCKNATHVVGSGREKVTIVSIFSFRMEVEVGRHDMTDFSVLVSLAFRLQVGRHCTPDVLFVNSN